MQCKCPLWEIPAEKMKPRISKTVYMSMGHYSLVLNVIAAQGRAPPPLKNSEEQRLDEAGEDGKRQR